MKAYRLKRPYLVIFTILVTITTCLFLQLMIVRAGEIKKGIQACDLENAQPCTPYEIRQYFIKNNL